MPSQRPSRDPAPRLTRRELLKTGAAAGIAAALGSATVRTAPIAPKSNPVTRENSLPGTTDWQLTFVRSQKLRSEMIEGFCSRTSARAGETIDVFLSSKPAESVTINLYRIGYYGGKGGRHVARFGPFPVAPQATPAVGPHRSNQNPSRLDERRLRRETFLQRPSLRKLHNLRRARRSESRSDFPNQRHDLAGL